MTMDNQQPSRDPFYDIVPERMWLKVTNIGVRDSEMVKVILEVNGQDKELFNQYVIDGTISHEFNLTRWLQNARIKALEEQVADQKQWINILKHANTGDNNEIRELESENARLKEELKWRREVHSINDTHTCHNNCSNPICEFRRENTELRSEVKRLTEKYDHQLLVKQNEELRAKLAEARVAMQEAHEYMCLDDCDCLLAKTLEKLSQPEGSK